MTRPKLRFSHRCTFFLIVLAALTGCYPILSKQAEEPEEALSPVRFFYPNFTDDMSFDALALAIHRNMDYLDRLDPETVFQYGPHTYTALEIRKSQETFLKLIADQPDPDTLNRKIQENYRIYRAAGRPRRGTVLFTGYFEPVFEARLKPTHLFQYPIYRKPDDLLNIDLSLFDEKYQGERVVARIQGKAAVPYYTRAEIDSEKVLAGRGLEIAWLKDPVDVAFLQIQGSGRLRLSDGALISVGYGASNGRPYRSIGRYLLEQGLMAREDLSMQGIRRYLAEHPQVRREVLNRNPSYIFFQVLDEGPLGNINVPITPGRTLALDSRLFPRGALAYISSQKPLITKKGRISRWRPFSRFVLNQDTGGAIRGAGRADLFWGSGPYAEIAAGHMKHEGELYLLVGKPSARRP